MIVLPSPALSELAVKFSSFIYHQHLNMTNFIDQIFLKKKRVDHVKNYHAFYGNRRFIYVLATANPDTDNRINTRKLYF